MLNKDFRLVAAFIFAIFCSANSSAEDKLLILKRVNNVGAKLLEVAERRKIAISRGEKLKSDEIRKLIQEINNLDVLGRLAVISRANRAPGRIEDQIVDDVMDEAWTRCINRMEQLGGDDAITLLEGISRQGQLDGADSVDVRRALEHLRERKKH